MEMNAEKANEFGLCKLCRDQIFNSTRFPDLLMGPEYDEEAGGIWLERGLEDSSAGCNFCQIVQEVLLTAFPREGERLLIRVYGICKRGRPIEDIYLLYFDIEDRVHRAYGVFANEDDAAAQIISMRRPHSLVDTPQAFATAQEWIRECNENHSLCRRKLSHLPTRVIDVTQSGSADSVRLLITNGIQAPYVALSYCWGAPQPQMLVDSKLRAYQESIATSSLPKSIQDAIYVVRKIGLRYLWVDSLCILQDSPDDKNHEIGRMAQIYQNSYIAIMVASAKTCEDGFLARTAVSQRDEATALPYFPRTDLKDPVRMLLRPWQAVDDYDPGQDPANSRAWIFQERVLSPRLLVYPSYPHPMQWRCLMANETNGGPVLDANEVGMEKLSPEFYSDEVKRESVAADSDAELCRLWCKIVFNYTSRRLTVGTDKLPAMAGVASEFGRLRGADAGKYCAGIWRNDMPIGLLWQPFGMDVGQGQDDGKTPTVYRAPSWSWASIDRNVLTSADPDAHTFEFDIIECTMELALVQSEFGEVKGGTLIVNAMLKTCMWDIHPRRLIDDDCYVGEGIADSLVSRGKVHVWCMPVLDSTKYTYEPTGILLEQAGEVFKRVGIMKLRKHDWFKDCKRRALTIV